MSKLNKTFKQDGIDLFFTNMSKSKAKYLLSFLNSLDRTMNGHPLKWKLNKDQSPHPIYGEEQKITITTRYPAVEYTVAQITYGLLKNRELMEIALKEMGFTETTYEGSEFYIKVEGDVKQFAKTYKEETDLMLKETA
jgi:hypothetical protein